MLPKGLGSLGDLSSMLKHAMSLKGKMEELRESLGNERIESSAGGGMVKVVLNGKFEIESLEIEPELINPEDPEVLQTMLMAAINEGVRKTQDLVKQRMTELTGGIDIPGLTS